VALISPDVATCPDCRAELADPADRRYRYPFTNCTNCGPRYTIIDDVPYDRERTTMAAFKMCPACRAEDNDPADRRFHAQPNACPACGPAYRLLDGAGRPLPGDPLAETRRLIAEGKIAAIKGLGGYHLACDARDAAAVAALRARKIREDKPFAVMAGSLDAVKARCLVSPAEEELLAGTVRPIVLLAKGPGYDLAPDVAPANPYVGAMLPYAPVHWLLLAPGDVWVMTSGNTSDEPIATRTTMPSPGWPASPTSSSSTTGRSAAGPTIRSPACSPAGRISSAAAGATLPRPCAWRGRGRRCWPAAASSRTPFA
jgi:hydrogenase maturation protein HypF